jgi:mono/diheme cytochrome c family protein
VGAGLAAEVPPTSSVLSAESRATYEQRVLPFLKQHCWKCHDESSAKAGFRVDELGIDFLAGKTADHWREAIDQINLGKMPKSKDKPDPREAFAVVEWVNQELRNAEKRAQTTAGRAPMRRLNRTEYANTVRDLFHLDEHFARKIEQELPADGKVDGFDRGGAALFFDKSQLQAYLDVAELVVREALPAEPVQANKYRALAQEDNNLLRRNPKMTTMQEVLDRGDIHFSDLLAKEPRPLPEVERGPEPYDLNVRRDGGVEIVAAWPYSEGLGGGQQMLQKVIKRDGWYRFKVKAGASRGNGKFAVDAVRIQADYCPQSRELRRSFTFTIDAPLDQPQVYEQTVFLRRGGDGFNPDLRFRWNIYHPWRGFHDDGGELIRTNPEMRKLYWAGRQSSEAYSRAKEMKQPPEKIAEAQKKRDEARDNLYRFALSFRGPVNFLNPEVDANDVQHLWYEYIEVEGPLAEWPTPATRELFGQRAESGDLDDARQIFARFLPRAYRRPVTAAEIEAQVRQVKTMQERHGKSFGDAVRATVVSVLVSPVFLFLDEPAGPDSQPRDLNDHELANRLSYYLWSTLPDAELTQRAAQKQLREPGVLRAEVQRMLADPRARQFVENFVGQWMRVRDFDSVMVDTRQYKDYDDALRDASLREPYEFFQELLRADLPVVNLLDSDFAVVNERLAKHYGLEGVQGEQFRRVPLLPEHRRGGILGMAGLLTYLSDGSRTLPVRRGAYVLDVLWNTPAPLPPPNAGDLPVIKGKNLTVRQRLEQHRSVAFCASCHTKIDPLGLALENYDAIGSWRERQNGEGRKGGKNDPPIDPSGIMPGGESFQTLPEFKRLLLEEKPKFLKGFTEKMLAYALGRPVGAADQELVTGILTATASEEHRLQAMVQAIVATRAFQTR